MTSQESTVGRDSMGFENIDEFWDTIGMQLCNALLDKNITGWIIRAHDKWQLQYGMIGENEIERSYFTFSNG